MADFVEGEDMTLKKNHPAGYNGITDGVIWHQLLLFFFPILFGTFFQQLYNTVDAVIVGRFVGKEALSCVSGSSGQIINLVVGFFTGLSAGATVMISQHFGAKNEEQLDRFASETVVDLKETLKQLSLQEVYGMVLGDIVWDHFEHFPVYKKEMARLKIPFYPVIGNHDHDKEILSDKASAHTYEKYFGPTYYAFQLGKVYCIVLDNILYEGNKKYTEALTEEQIQWVDQLLKYLPENAPILIATHSPFYYADRGIIPGGEELFGILKNHPVSLISGHTHLNSNHEIKPGIIEHNIGAICGTWWTADENRDGTPNGYDVFEITGSEIEWFYKSVGNERNWQFNVFPRGTV